MKPPGTQNWAPRSPRVPCWWAHLARERPCLPRLWQAACGGKVLVDVGGPSFQFGSKSQLKTFQARFCLRSFFCVPHRSIPPLGEDVSFPRFLKRSKPFQAKPACPSSASPRRSSWRSSLEWVPHASEISLNKRRSLRHASFSSMRSMLWGGSEVQAHVLRSVCLRFWMSERHVDCS